MVFEVDPGEDSGDAFTACSDTVPAGTAGCVVYNAGIIQEVSTVDAADLDVFRSARFDVGNNASTVFDPDTGVITAHTCDTGKADENWCASARTIDGDVSLGVAISYKHEWFTGIFPFESPTFEEFVISSTFSGAGTDLAVGP